MTFTFSFILCPGIDDQTWFEIKIKNQLKTKLENDLKSYRGEDAVNQKNLHHKFASRSL